MKHTGWTPWMGFLRAAVMLGLLIQGCAQPVVKKKAPPHAMAKAPVRIHKAPEKPSYWNGDDVEGSPSIVIRLSEQRAFFYKGTKLVGESTVSTGRKGFETPPGHYTVIQKDKDHVSNMYGDYVDAEGNIVKKNVDVTKTPMPEGAVFAGAKMPFFMRFTGGYGMHAGYLPGYRASHGCIRMPGEMAEHFFDNAEEGTPVKVEE